MNKQKALMITVLCFAFAFSATAAFATLTWDATSGTSTGALNLTGVSASTVTVTSSEAAEDLTLSVTGATDSSVKLASSGTGADAISLITSAGGMDLTVAGAAAGEDMDLTSNSSINLTATEDAALSIYLQENGGTSGTIKIYANQGTSVTEGAASIELLSDDGGVELRSTANLANAIALTSDGGTTGSILVYNDQGTAVTSIYALSDVGGITLSSGLSSADAINISATGTAGGIDIDSGTGGVIADSTGVVSIDGADDVNLTVTAGTDGEDLTISEIGATDSSVILTSAGTGTDAIGIHATAGGIDIDTASTTAAALDIDATGTVSGNAITVNTTNGGILIQAGNATNGDIAITAADDLTLTGGPIALVGATNITGAVTVGVDDTGHDVTFYGATASSNLLWDESADALEFAGVARLDLSGATVLAANTDGGVIKAGASGSPIVEDTADMKFMSFYFDNGATSGDNRGIYNKLDLTGAGGGGESLRSYTDIVGVAAGTAHGAHISLGMGESTTGGSVTGLGVGVRATLGLPSVALAAGGTYAAMMPEIYSFGASADPAAVTEVSFIRFDNAGNATGMGKVDDKAFLMSLQGLTDGDAHVFSDGGAVTNYSVTATLKVKIGGTTFYIPLGTTASTD